jgi:hypothetical protein
MKEHKKKIRDLSKTCCLTQGNFDQLKRISKKQTPQNDGSWKNVLTEKVMDPGFF